MPSYIDIESWDGDNRRAHSVFPVADVALPTGYAAKVQAVVDALTANGVDNEIIANADCIYGYRVRFQNADNTDTPPIICDLRNTWEFLGKPISAADGTQVFRFQVSGRALDSGNIAQGSRGFLVNDANVAYQTLQTALLSGGVDMKTPYNITASAQLVGGRALTAKRKAGAQKGGALPGQTGAITFIDLLFRDYENRTGVASFPVANQALPTGYGAKVDAIVNALEDTATAGTPLVVPGSILRWTVNVETILSTTRPTGGDIRDTWEVPLVTDAGDYCGKFSLPCRNTDYSLTSESSDGKQIDTSNQGWIDFLAAMADAGVDLRNPKIWANDATPQTAFAKTTRRQIPV